MNRANPANPPVLEMRGIRKSFDGVEVLHGVDFAARRGAVHALVGENGAGKSTLINILGGVYGDYAGTIQINGRSVRIRTPRDAARCGVAIIHQELSLLPHLSVAENIFLGRAPRTRLGCVDWSAMRRDAHKLLLTQLGVELDVRRDVAELPLGLRHIVEIAKALCHAAGIVVMDEPTSALSDAEVNRLFEIIRQLRKRNISVIYISHKLDEIYRIADVITVLRDGKTVASAPTDQMERGALVRHMVGRGLDRFFPRHKASAGAELLKLEDVSVYDHAAGGSTVVRKASMVCRRGEIVGIAGLLGSGVSDLMGAVFGRFGRRARGRVSIDGSLVRILSPRAAIKRGIAFLTCDRKAEGLVLPMSSARNMTLASLARCRRAGILRRGLERPLVESYEARMNIRAASLSAPVATLSGGNQQKVVLAKWLMTEPRLLLCDDPTRGVDIGAKAEIYALINELVEAGLGIVLSSSDLTELLALSDRIYVMHRGRIVAEFSRADATQERVMAAAMGE